MKSGQPISQFAPSRWFGFRSNKARGLPRRHRLVLVIGLASAGALQAQAPAGIDLPEALKGMKPAVGMCRAEREPSTVNARASRPKGQPPELACALAPADLPERLKNPTTLLVDVRPAQDYAAFHLEGALNASVAEVAASRVFRGKSVILVGSGKGERELYSGCARLRRVGLKQVSVLRGGMTAAPLLGSLAQGHVPDASRLGRLSPAELWVESRFGANLPVLAPGASGLSSHLKGAITLPDTEAASLQRAIAQHRSKSGALAAVILVAPELSIDRWSQLREALQPIPLLGYTETADAYQQQLARQEAIWVAQARGPRQPSCGL